MRIWTRVRPPSVRWKRRSRTGWNSTAWVLSGHGRTGAIGRYAESPGEGADLTATETAVPLDSLGPDADLSGEAELETLCDRAADAGLTPYGARLTTRDLEQLGFEAVRVVCPSAQPLFFGDSFFGERAEAVPADLGFEPRLDREHHPFP